MMLRERLASNAKRLAGEGRGILAADESSGTIAKRLATIGLASTAAIRRAYRAMLFGTPNLGNYISGAILFDESIRDSSLTKLLTNSGILIGIKVDKGAQPMPLHVGEFLTEGLDGLRDRLIEYADLGAVFAKWRAVIRIGDGLPSMACIKANVEQLAIYAAQCQSVGLVPIVEPEILMDGDHDLERCYDVTKLVLQELFEALVRHGVYFQGMLLKPNMVTSGSNAEHQASIKEVAEATVRCFSEVLPDDLGGVVFLSGGQTEVEATAHLDAMNKLGFSAWPLSFSFGRALQDGARAIWAGVEENVPAAQACLLRRARNNMLATAGRWSQDLEEAA